MTEPALDATGLDSKSGLSQELWYDALREDYAAAVEAAGRKLRCFEPAAAAAHLRRAADRAAALADLVADPDRRATYRDRARSFRADADELDERGVDAIETAAPSTGDPPPASAPDPSDADGPADPEVAGPARDGDGTRDVEPRREGDPPAGADAPAGGETRDGPGPRGPADDPSAAHRRPSVDLGCPDVTFEEYGGREALKGKLLSEVADPIEDEGLHRVYGVEPLRGIVLEGPPGSGKTHLLRAFAGTVGWNFLELTPADVVSALVGEGARNVRDYFEVARGNQPCILFFDEIDNVAKARGASTRRSQSEEAMLTQLLQEMTALDAEDDVVVVAATNRPDAVDDALYNAERFGEVIEVPQPDAETRRAVLRVHLRDRRVPATGVDYDAVAERTEGFSAAAMKRVATDAARAALEEAKEADGIVPIRHRHVERAIECRADSREARGGTYLGGDATGGGATGGEG